MSPGVSWTASITRWISSPSRTSAAPATTRRWRRPAGTISAKGKHVVVVGGGDTGSDCIGTSARQGAASIVQIEIMPKPPVKENKAMVWPDWPIKLRSSHAHDEGVERDWSVLTKHAVGVDGKVTALDCVRVEWERTPDGRMTMKEVPGSEFQFKADLVLLAMGFLGPRRGALLDQAGVELDQRGNVLANTVQYQTSRDKLFAAGDMRRGQSLVVWAIREGRQCARSVDQFLMGSSSAAAVGAVFCQLALMSYLGQRPLRLDEAIGWEAIGLSSHGTCRCRHGRAWPGHDTRIDPAMTHHDALMTRPGIDDAPIPNLAPKERSASTQHAQPGLTRPRPDNRKPSAPTPPWKQE